MTTLDAEIALVRRMLGEGWEVENRGGLHARIGNPGRDLDFKEVHQYGVAWQGYVDLARKLEAAERRLADDPLREFSAAFAKKLDERGVPEPAAAERVDAFFEKYRKALDADERSGYAVLRNGRVETVRGEMGVRAGTPEPTAAELFERVAVAFERHNAGGHPSLTLAAMAIRAALAGRTP